MSVGFIVTVDPVYCPSPTQEGFGRPAFCLSPFMWASKGPEPGRVQPSSARAAHVVGPSPWVGHLFAGTHGDLFVLDETGQGLGMV